MPCASSTSALLAQSLQAMQWVRWLSMPGRLGNCAAKLASWLVEEGVEARRRPVRRSPCSRARRARSPARGRAAPSSVAHAAARIDVGAAAHALPVGDRAARRVCGEVRVEAVARAAAAAVLVAGHHHHGAVAAREVPEARQRGLRELLGSGSRAAAAARPPAGSRPCRGRSSRGRRGRRSRIGGARRRAPRPAQAGLPWRV